MTDMTRWEMTLMRKLTVSTIASLDGYVEGPGKDVTALPFDDGFSAYNVQRLRAAGILLSGRRSFEDFRDYWPAVADDETQGATEREISRLNNAIEKVVISDTLTAAETAPWEDTTRIVRRDDAAEAVRALKAQDGGDIFVAGSRTTWNALLVEGLVDELHVMVGPALLGAGTPLIGDPGPVPLQLLEARLLPNSQLVLLRYAPHPD
ncbi:dihydrofolate reductase family protein [Actinomadura sp. NEAU-AAG7]|uniref:dihydrofolate reductase family protein n=1 Tax=Actinomadura sp. NEAU-AAG7 TaxID=2839640 RepID=UPI002032DCBD|nr:dihydrofolate reductase family protein [Actinomadura sp. NEAU-AAG7]